MRFFLLLLICLNLSLPLAAQDGLTAPIATENSAITDAAIAQRLRDIIQELGGYDDITVQVSDGIVTLRGTTTSAVEVNTLNDLTTRVEGVVAVKNEVTETADLARRLDPALDRFIARTNQLLANLPVAIVAIAIFAAITWIGSRIARLKNPWDRLAPNSFIADLYRQIVFLAFGLIALVIALDILNATALLSTILGAAGIIGLALGFAVKDTVENYIASVMLSIRQPFRPNDVVEINGDEGKVIRLTSRATILLSFDGNHIRIPNATVFKSRIVNYSQNAERRFKFTIGIEPETDLARARELAAETVQALPFVIENPATQSWIENFTASGVEITTAGWIDQRETSILLARGEAMRQVKRVFENEGITIPDTTYRIRVEGSLDGPASPKDSTVVSEASDVVGVASETESALEQMISDERNQDEVEDLLDARAQKE